MAAAVCGCLLGAARIGGDALKRDLLLWMAILTGPVLWFVNLETDFALAPTACTGGKVAIYAVALVCLLITAGMGFLALSVWRRLDADSMSVERARVMAVAGVVLSASFAVVIFAQMLPDFILAGCE